MKRRKFLTGVTGVAIGAATGAAMVFSGREAKAPAVPRTTPTIFDFGAKGDGSTDDSAAFRKALEVASLEGRKIIVPGFVYAIARPIDFHSKGNATAQWGLECQGATLLSRLNAGEDILSMSSGHVVRYFNLTGGLTIKGNGRERHGFRIFAPGGGNTYFYNAAIDRLSVEGVGEDGLMMEGNVFESQITNSYFQDCKRNGATFAHSKGGVCSAINVIGCYFNQNGRYGLEATNMDGEYGGATDIRVLGGYCRQNGSYGFRYNNGTSAGGAVTQVGFENNCTSKSPGDPAGAHVYALVRVQMRDCAGYNEFGGATYLLKGWFSELTLLDGCSQSSGGAMQQAGNSRLVHVEGAKTGHVVLRGCAGGLTVAPGTACTWQASYSTGPSPAGELSLGATSGSR